ncbi:hypothetical protein [Ruminococcus flavefaciens]|uniref:hypothetical protein n=1 Tax=Ruminococcus flavefaciens TaxID=1265 RepID=UPI0026EE2123|nr:hypothetical protein [Ruminococcus flavefaciens]
MELYLQLGHGMQNLAQELLGIWGKGNVIISPVNIQRDKLKRFAKKIRSCGGQVLFDPQMFYPKEGHEKLQAYDYWLPEGVSITSEDGYKTIDQELYRINQEIESSCIILPGIEMNEQLFTYGIKWMKESASYFLNKTEKPLLATLCLYPETIRNNEAIENLVERLKNMPVHGYYVIPHPSNNEYIISDPMWVVGMMKLLTCLKLMNKKVVVGYSNHQSLIYALAKVDAIASGTYMNTRSFVPSKFKSPKDDGIKNKSTWYYLPSAFCEYKAALLDVAFHRGFLDLFYSLGEFNNQYSDILFKGALPSSTNYNESNSFKHYLYCLKIQCDMLSLKTYKETYDTYEFMLQTAENQLKEIKKKGMSGQNRDFSPAIEVNRIAMCANDEDYGLKLRLDWDCGDVLI